jgi:hypothetical protein
VVHVTRDPPSRRRIHTDETNKHEMYKNLGHLAGKSWSTRNKGPGVEFAPTAVHASPTLEVNLWLKNCRSAQSSSMELRREKLRSSVYCVCGLVPARKTFTADSDRWITGQPYEQRYGVTLMGSALTHTYCSGCYMDFMQRVRPTRQATAPLPN